MRPSRSDRKRPFSSTLECPICYENFDLDHRCPVIGICGHTICASCRNRLPQKCPMCQREHAFENETKNFTLVNIIEERLREAPLPKRPKGYCFHCLEPLASMSSAMVCVECLKKKPHDTFEDLIKQLSIGKMCTKCSQIVSSHCGHKMNSFQPTQSAFLSRILHEDITITKNNVRQNFLDLRDTLAVHYDTFKDLYKTLALNPHLPLGVEVNWLRDQMLAETDVVNQILCEGIKQFWMSTQRCLKANKSIAQQMQKQGARKFTASEREMFGSFFDRPTDNEADRNSVKLDDWIHMNAEEKEAKAHEMLQRFLPDASESLAHDQTHDEDHGAQQE